MKEPRFVSLRLTPPGSRRRCQSKEYEYGLIETQDILVVQAPDKRTDFGYRNGGHLVHHKAAGRWYEGGDLAKTF